MQSQKYSFKPKYAQRRRFYSVWCFDQMRGMIIAMKNMILEKLKTAKGKVGFYYKNLVTCEEICFNENDAFLAASVIKLPILAEIFRQSALKSADMSEIITVKNSEKMPSCGALTLFTGEPTVDIRTLCNLMIALSDNTATNVLMKHFNIDKLNSGFREIGLEKTKINRLLFDEEAQEQGKENVFVPREIGCLLEQIYHKTFVNEQVSTEIEKILLDQQINHKIPGKLPDDIRVAHKTGEDDGITNDVGIVYADEPFIIVFASNDTDVLEFEQIIREISYQCCKLS
ncbi:class A beta-lactamase-related serine hydrolase [Tissierella sp. MSJ-40]|uniref:Class A beta-lactamase-related serine hydrolase n=1 Tax=Tissierella simiarum TaxID=2841534 RepID=A0ABS6E935_9FIRM|nr:serine hydrolase [Tissierella simiarum]MBU5439426.1 class A beta-lactamase-related serine hydrolase [Tissierella simiarum]